MDVKLVFQDEIWFIIHSNEDNINLPLDSDVFYEGSMDICVENNWNVIDVIGLEEEYLC